MYKLFIALITGTFLMGCNSETKSKMSTDVDTSTAKESDNDWQLLFDGKTTSGWHAYGKGTIGKAWKVEDSALHLNAAEKKDGQMNEGGDLVTDDEYENFHLKLEWKIAPKGNSGIMIYVIEDTSKYEHPYNSGPEIQVLDNEGHPDAKIPKHRAGDLYDLIPVSKETVRPAGEWNQVEIISNNGKLDEHLNGEHVLSATMWNDEWNKLIANSKFKSMPGFGTYKKGKIALQDHGDDVWFRNIKIKKL